MIKIANDAGSAELIPKFSARSAPCQLAELPAGDFVFSGNGPDGDITIGVERKTLGDLIQSMHSGRLTAKQIPRMLEWFDQSYLLVEGIYRSGTNGELLEFVRGGWHDVRSGKTTYDGIQHFLMTMAIKTGGAVQILWTSDMDQTAALVSSLYRWYNAPWDSHRSFNAFHVSAPKRPIANIPREADVLSGRTSLEDWKRWNCRLFAKEIHGIGWELSEVVANHFGSVRKAVLASTKDWMEITGIGPTLAKRVDRAL